MTYDSGSSQLIDLPTFDYPQAAVSDLKALGHRDPKTGSMVADKIVLPDGREARPTSRFWISLGSRFQFGPSVFRLFDHYEVFQRIGDTGRFTDDQVQLCVERGDNPRLWGVTKPGRKMLYDEQAIAVYNHLGVERASFCDGKYQTIHTPLNLLGINRKIGPDDFAMKIALETPIDGYGDPAVFLSLWRQVCTNGVIAHSKIFRSAIQVGSEDPVGTAIRILESFQNEEGYAALLQRMDASQRTHASVAECVRVGKLVANLAPEDFDESFSAQMAEKTGQTDTGTIGKTLRSDLFKHFRNLTGDLRALYGVADLNSISEKRQRMTPTPCHMYRLLNFVTEVATHQLTPDAARKFTGVFGDLIAKEYDLENSVVELGEFEDFIDPNSKTARDHWASGAILN